MSIAALDSDNNVIAYLKGEGTWTVAEINARMSEKGSSLICATVINTTAIVTPLQSSDQLLTLSKRAVFSDRTKKNFLFYYHQKTSGDGSQPSHYTRIEDLRAYKYGKNKSIEEMICTSQECNGFTYDNNKYHYTESLMDNSAVQVTYPINVYDIWYEKQTLANQSALNAFFNASVSRTNVLKDWAISKFTRVNAASTQSAIDAVDLSDMP